MGKRKGVFTVMAGYSNLYGPISTRMALRLRLPSAFATPYFILLGTCKIADHFCYRHEVVAESEMGMAICREGTGFLSLMVWIRMPFRTFLSGRQ